MSSVTLYRVYHPMRNFRAGMEPWAWPDETSKQFPGSIRPSGEVWLDELSDSPRAFLDLVRASGSPQPCTSLTGHADAGRLGPYETFQLRFKEVVELAQELDNFADQQSCAWQFPVMRYGVSGCGRGAKQRLKAFRFPKKFKKPRYDFFSIAPGPRLPPSYFGVSQRALDAFEAAGLTGYVARPLMLFDGSDSGSFEIEVVGRTSAPLPHDGYVAEQVCSICGLFQVFSSQDQLLTNIGPLPDIFSDVDLQVCVEQKVRGVVHYADDWPPFASRKFIEVCAQHKLSGLVPGGAGGRFEPVVTESVYRSLKEERL